MAVIAYVVLPGVAKERYDQIRAEVGWLGEHLAGGISHVTDLPSGPRGIRPAGGEDHRLTPGAGSFLRDCGDGRTSGLDPGQPMVEPGPQRYPALSPRAGMEEVRTTSDGLTRLNGVAVVFEYEADESGKSSVKSYEWK